MVEVVDGIEEELMATKAYGNNGLSVATPESETEIVNILHNANDEGKKVSIMGRGTKRGYGGLKEEYDVVVSLAKYKGIVEHTVGDMTVTVKPGTTIAELQDYLQKHDQMVSIDPKWPRQATVGGVIAANDSGPKRLMYGSARDLVIGLRVVYPDGKCIRTGGKVVKNVAGYDMNKLFIGSMGTLGVITEVTMKLRPIPKYESLVLLNVEEAHLEELRSFVVSIQDSMLEPVSLELMNPTLSKKIINREEYALLIALEDVENAVHYQEEWIGKHQPAGSTVTIFSSKEAKGFWEKFSNMAPNSINEAPTDNVKATIKMGSKNMDVLDILRECQKIQDGTEMMLEAHGGLGHGLSHLYLTGTEAACKSTITQLREYVEKKRGYAILTHLPFTLREELNSWSKTPSYFFLLEGIKRKIDPKNTLNHQRFLGGI